MKLAQIQSAILCSSLLLGITPVLAAYKVIILQVQLNSALTQLTITGHGFTAGDKVSLGTSDISTRIRRMTH